ncbi:hypothetical protein C2S51_034476 [Perilla frutescens var. frutescens]|nr:hypothetical protein C2S51_034476 [Perilla frutescens var. frutescens]
MELRKMRIANNISEGDKFDIVMVDLDSSDVMNGVCAPPVEFVEKYVLRAEVFEELYEIDVGNGENFVLIATRSIIRNTLDGNAYNLVTADHVQNTRLLVSLNTSSCSPGNSKCGQSIRAFVFNMKSTDECYYARHYLSTMSGVDKMKDDVFLLSWRSSVQGFRLLTATRYEDDMEKSTACKSFCTNNTNKISPEAYLND